MDNKKLWSDKRHLRFWPLLLLVIFCLPSVIFAQTPEISVVYPKEEQDVFAQDSTFIFGSVTPGARLHINGSAVPVLDNGAFLAFLPVFPGEFVFSCRAILGADTTYAVRKVSIPSRMVAYPIDSLGFDSTYVFPMETCELQPGIFSRCR